MIKIIAFDLVGVLITEKRNILSKKEEKIERMFGKNISDNEFIKKAKNILNTKKELLDTSKEIINKLYIIKEPDIIKIISKEYNNIKIIIATNHISLVKEYIKENFNINEDDIIISAEINKIKPNYDFYNYILDKYSINNNELLFIDDNKENTDSANSLGIKTIRVDRETDLLKEIKKEIDNQINN